MNIKQELKAFNYEPLCKIYQTIDRKNISEAIKELINFGCSYYVYFETPFSVRYIGFDNVQNAKRAYNQILKVNKDLYGCVVSVDNVY